MPWCPKCRIEYEDWVKTCSDCGEELVKDLLPESEPKKETEYDKEAFLATVPDDIHADLTETLLKAYGIPVHRRYKEAGAYMQIYMGMARFGVDLYVPSKLLQQARDIIESHPVETEADKSEDTALEELEGFYQRKRRTRTWIILLILFIPVLLAIITGFIYALIEYLSKAI